MNQDNSMDALINKSKNNFSEIEDVDSTTKSMPLGKDHNPYLGSFKYILYPYRWAIQITFTIALVSNGFLMVGFSPIAANVAAIFDCNSLVVQVQTLIFLMAFIPGNFIVIKTLDKYGLKVCFLIGAGGTMVGAWMRMLIMADDNFLLVIPGTIVCSFAQVFFINTSSKLASTWFGDKERSLATALGGLALPIGCIIGFIVPAIMVTETGVDKELGKNQFYTYLLTQNCIVTAGCLPLLIVAKEKPPSPPSKSAGMKEMPLNFKKEWNELIKNKSYILLGIAFTCLYGIYTSLGSVVSSITAPYGYTSVDNAIFGGVFIFFGVAGSFIFGMLLDKYQKFKLIINCTSISAVVVIACTFATLPSQNVGLLAFNLALIGFTVIPIIPISYAFAVELTFPVSESVSNGMIVLPSQIYGTILGLVASLVCSYSPMYAITIFVCSSSIGALAALFIKEDLRRLKPKNSESVVSHEKLDSSQNTDSHQHSIYSQ